MDIIDLIRAFSLILVLVSFALIALWLSSPNAKKRAEKDRNIPFED